MTVHFINSSMIYSLTLWAALMSALCNCTGPNPLTGGGGTETVVGKVVSENGSTAANSMVELLPSNFNPAAPLTLEYNPRVKTDNSGVYVFKDVPPGNYTLQAVNLNNRTKALKTGIVVAKNNVSALEDTLHLTGTITVTLPSNASTVNGYLYIPGTNITASINEKKGFVTIDSIPAGTLPAILYGSRGDTAQQVIRYNVRVFSADTTMVKNPYWYYAQQLHLNTTESGAQVNGPVMNFPLLIRLTKDNFNFTEARLHGEDIRFRKSDDTPMHYDIEHWDAENKSAQIWVKIDTVYGADSTQSLTMYWGNSNAVDSSNDRAVFDTAAGFAGVWHMSQSAGAAINDATINRNHGTATATSTAPGMIGMAQTFNGKSSFIRTSGAAEDKLNFPENSTFSVSAWVKTNVSDSLFQGILYKSNFQYGLQIRPEGKWEFFTFIQNTAWEGSQYPIEINSWHFLTGVRKGTQQYLYVDGKLADSNKVVLSSDLSRSTDSPLEIGHCADGGKDPDRFFNGYIDEVRVSSVENSADYIKLCYMNQKEQDMLVKW